MKDKIKGLLKWAAITIAILLILVVGTQACGKKQEETKAAVEGGEINYYTEFQDELPSFQITTSTTNTNVTPQAEMIVKINRTTGNIKINFITESNQISIDLKATENVSTGPIPYTSGYKIQFEIEQIANATHISNVNGNIYRTATGTIPEIGGLSKGVINYYYKKGEAVVSLFTISYPTLISPKPQDSQYIYRQPKTLYVLEGGVANNYQNGYNDGYNDGVEQGKTQGYTQGYNAGTASASKGDYTFMKLMDAVLFAPVKAFTSLTSVNILGFNIGSVMTGILTLLAIIALVRLVL